MHIDPLLAGADRKDRAVRRVDDGALGAELLAAFKGLIETPIMMLA